MRVRVLSDLHLEFEPVDPPIGPLAAGLEWRFTAGALPPVDADVIVLAGDIGVGARGVRWARETFTQPVVYVAGNHEFYGGRFALVWDEMRREAAGSSVHLLENEAFVWERGGERVRFLGCTLWTDFALHGERNVQGAMMMAEIGMTDYRVVHIDAPEGERSLRAADTRALHLASRRFLEHELAQPFEGTTVVVTHMLPTAKCIHPRFDRSPLNAAFASDLEPLLARHQTPLWIHGHTHESCDLAVEGTRVLCNPRGYLPDDPNLRFDPRLVVTLP